nr:hypothetical protein [Tanacetum cinerariifolium]
VQQFYDDPGKLRATPNLVISTGDVCLSWGRWGGFVGGRGSGGNGLESGGSGVMLDGGKTG